MPTTLNRKYITSALLIFGISISGPSQAEDDGDAPTVTPYRPTVSNPAALSAAGWLEVETGINQQKSGDGSKQATLPYLLKYAFSEDFGILLGGDAHMIQTDPGGNRNRGIGDTQFLLKHRWAMGDGNDAPAFGLEWGVKLPTAGKTLGSGKNDYIINGIYSSQISGYGIDLNLNATQLGAHDAGTSATQWGWAGTISRSLNERWGVAAELSGVSRRGVQPENQALFAVNYAVSKRVVIDAGMAVGLSKGAADYNFFTGISFLFAKFS